MNSLHAVVSYGVVWGVGVVIGAAGAYLLLPRCWPSEPRYRDALTWERRRRLSAEALIRDYEARRGKHTPTAAEEADDE